MGDKIRNFSISTFQRDGFSDYNIIDVSLCKNKLYVALREKEEPHHFVDESGEELELYMGDEPGNSLVIGVDFHGNILEKVPIDGFVRDIVTDDYRVLIARDFGWNNPSDILCIENGQLISSKHTDYPIYQKHLAIVGDNIFFISGRSEIRTLEGELIYRTESEKEWLQSLTTDGEYLYALVGQSVKQENKYFDNSDNWAGSFYYYLNVYDVIAISPNGNKIGEIQNVFSYDTRETRDLSIPFITADRNRLYIAQNTVGELAESCTIDSYLIRRDSPFTKLEKDSEVLSCEYCGDIIRTKELISRCSNCGGIYDI
jgi:hypothetical protein